MPAIEQRVLKAHFVGKGKNTQTLYSDRVKQIASSVLGRSYTSAERYGSNDLYSLNVVNNGMVYSGFNMGAGEDVVFTLVNMLLEVPADTLVIIEEVETGLHPKAQKELIRHIIDIAFERHLQVIMTTHSQLVLESLPPEGRVLLRRSGLKIVPEYKVSGNYAFSILAQQSMPELTIYTEDDVAQNMVLEALPTRLRKRVRVIHVGSWTVVTSQIASFYRDRNLGNTLAVYDGDCTNSAIHNEFKKRLGLHTLEPVHISWFENHSYKLPGDEPPEKWLMNMKCLDEFCKQFADWTNCEYEEIIDILQAPFHEDHHDYFHYLSEKVGLSEEQVKIKFVQVTIRVHAGMFNELISKIENILNENLIRA